MEKGRGGKKDGEREGAGGRKGGDQRERGMDRVGRASHRDGRAVRVSLQGWPGVTDSDSRRRGPCRAGPPGHRRRTLTRLGAGRRRAPCSPPRHPAREAACPAGMCAPARPSVSPRPPPRRAARRGGHLQRREPLVALVGGEELEDRLGRVGGLGRAARIAESAGPPFPVLLGAGRARGMMMRRAGRRAGRRGAARGGAGGAGRCGTGRGSQ